MPFDRGQQNLCTKALLVRNRPRYKLHLSRFILKHAITLLYNHRASITKASFILLTIYATQHHRTMRTSRLTASIPLGLFLASQYILSASALKLRGLQAEQNVTSASPNVTNMPGYNATSRFNETSPLGGNVTASNVTAQGNETKHCKYGKDRQLVTNEGKYDGSFYPSLVFAPLVAVIVGPPYYGPPYGWGCGYPGCGGWGYGWRHLQVS